MHSWAPKQFPSVICHVGLTSLFGPLERWAWPMLAPMGQYLRRLMAPRLWNTHMSVALNTGVNNHSINIRQIISNANTRYLSGLATGAMWNFRPSKSSSQHHIRGHCCGGPGGRRASLFEGGWKHELKSELVPFWPLNRNLETKWNKTYLTPPILSSLSVAGRQPRSKLSNKMGPVSTRWFTQATSKPRVLSAFAAAWHATAKWVSKPSWSPSEFVATFTSTWKFEPTVPTCTYMSNVPTTIDISRSVQWKHTGLRQGMADQATDFVDSSLLDPSLLHWARSEPTI